jgi:hypothetical protein
MLYIESVCLFVVVTNVLLETVDEQPSYLYGAFLKFVC